MHIVCQTIDNRNASIFRKLLYIGMLVRANHNAIQIAGQHTCRILDWLSASQLHIIGIQIQCSATQLCHSRFKGNTGSGG